jgi:hypothetical protein
MNPDSPFFSKRLDFTGTGMRLMDAFPIDQGRDGHLENQKKGADNR